MNLFCVHCGQSTKTETIGVGDGQCQRFVSHLRLITHAAADPTQVTFEQETCKGSGVRVKVD